MGLSVPIVVYQTLLLSFTAILHSRHHMSIVLLSAAHYSMRLLRSVY